MSNSVEIFQNTLLKLVVRSGTDSDRLSIVLDVGEIGYTTDTKRLYVGDGVTLGGVLAGNVIIGQVAGFSAISTSPLAIGDLVYVTGSSTLYRYIGGTRTLSTSWSAVGRIYSPENTTLVFTGSGDKIRVGTLSANNFSNDAVGRNIIIDSGRIALSANIALDSITPLSNTFVALPSSLKIGLSTYQFPISSSQPANSFLTSDGAGNLRWSSAATLLTAASATLVTGKGLTLSVNGVKSTQALLLTSGYVQFDTVFSPSHFVEFSQDGTITRTSSAGITVTTVPWMTLSALPNVIATGLVDGKSDPSIVSTVFDEANTTGAWLIGGLTNFNSVSSVIDVKVKNATYRYGATGNPISDQIIIPDLNSRYIITGGSPPYSLYVYTYVSRVGTSADNKQRWLPPVLTPGFDDLNTRISVTIYE